MEPKIVCLAAICVFLVHNVIAESSKNVSSNNPISTKPPTDELFIDDGLDNPEDSDIDGTMLADDGSGMGPTSKGTGVEDMESSGSGYGPDDEDAEVDVKNKDKTDVDSDQDEDDDDEDDDDEDDEEIKQDLNKEKIQKNKAAATTPTTTTTSTTTTTTENYDENSRIIDLPKQKTNVDDDVNVPPEVTQITSTSTLPPPPPNAVDDHSSINGVYISPNNHPERTSSFFAQPGILAAVIGGAVVGLLCAILVVMFIVYRMRKKDEGSYPLEETKRSPATNPYLKSTHREFYA